MLQEPMKKARTYTLENYPMMEDIWVPTLLLLTLLCARLGNGHGVMHVSVEEPKQSKRYKWMGNNSQLLIWKAKWFKHKSISWIGQRTVNIPIAADTTWGRVALTAISKLQAKQKICSDGVQSVIQMKLQDQKFGKHSIRRSGAKFWHSMGMPLQQLQTITLHQSIQSLLIYLED